MVVVSNAFSPPAEPEDILFESQSTKLLVNHEEVGIGTLYITKSNVTWGGGNRPSGAPAPPVTLLYPTVSLHAIERDPSPALYMIINYELQLPGLDQTTDDEDDNFDADNQPITQLRFVPANEGDLQAIYNAMVQGQSLHPDPNDEVDEDFMDGEEFDEAGDDEFEDAEEQNPNPDDAASRMRHLRLENANGNHNYEDAEEDGDTEE